VRARFEAADRAEWRSHWRIVLGVATGMGTGVALYLLVSSLFVTRITEEFGWSRGDMSLAAGVAYIAGALSLAVIGRLLDRHGYRRIVLVCVPGLALVYLGLASIEGSFLIYTLLMVVAGVFGTGTGAIAYTRPLIAAFDRQRGLALGVAASGISVTAMLVPPLLAVVIATYGWRAGFIAMAVITAGIGLPLTLWFLRGAKNERHVDTEALALSELPEATEAERRAPSIPLRAAMRGAQFWLLAIALVAINIPGSGIMGQLAPLLSDQGLSDAAIGIALSVYAMGLMAGRLLTGFALDRLPVARVAAFMTGVPALGALILLVPEPHLAIALLAVALLGLQQGSELDLLAYFISRNFGFGHYSAIFGAIAAAGALATASGLVLFGQVHDFTGSYTIALIVGAIAFLVGAAAFFATGRVARPLPA
jgi:sugar phosphate permease